MNTKQLPYILAIAQSGSLSAAANQLNISQPALTKYLKGLENQVGLKLFLRQKKRFYPTAAGKVYLKMANQILELQKRTLSSIENLTDERTVLPIGVSPHRGSSILAKMYPKFRQMFPSFDLIPLEGYAAQMRSYIKERKTTYAISTCSDALDPYVQHLLLFKENLLFSVPAFHPLAERAANDCAHLTSIDIRLFQDAPFVMMGPDTTIGGITQRLFQKVGLSPTTIYTSNNILMVSEMLQTGVGVGLIPPSYAKPSKLVVYFRLLQPCHIFDCVLTAQGHTLTKEERYLVYLQLMQDVNTPNYHICWNDDLHGIVDEFNQTSHHGRNTKD